MEHSRKFIVECLPNLKALGFKETGEHKDVVLQHLMLIEKGAYLEKTDAEMLQLVLNFEYWLTPVIGTDGVLSMEWSRLFREAKSVIQIGYH